MICKICGKSAGLFSSIHKECVIAHSNAMESIPFVVSRSINSNMDLGSLNSEVGRLADDGFINQYELDDLFVLGFDESVENFLEDGVISEVEDDRISEFIKYFNLNQKFLDKNGSYSKVAMGLVLNDIFQGRFPKSRMDIPNNLPFLLDKDESIIWIFQNVKFNEQQNKTTYLGTSQGISIKIANGIYYRTGQFRGFPVTNSQMTFIGKGMFALTNKNFYFSSSTKSFKTPYAKLISMTQYSVGIGVQKDGASSKPQVFAGLNGWFTYNLISNLRRSEM